MKAAIVVGAGVFGSSTARELARRGWQVTLVEQYSPGTVRSASGGDTRLLRMAHGDAEWYSVLARRARELWLELQELDRRPDLGTDRSRLVRAASRRLRERSRETLDAARRSRTSGSTPDAATDLYPSLGTDDLHGVLYEPDAGVLHARRATQLLVEDAERLGARLESRRVSPGDSFDADAVVWACGAWLPRLFPGEVELVISRREVFFLGGGPEWRGTPGFCEYDAPFYGHGDVGGLGVKIAPDGPGEEVDPDSLERVPSDERRREAHAYAAKRFPALADAPVIGARVCQYSLTAGHALHRRAASGTTTRGGSSAAGPDTASSTGRHSASTSQTASKAAARRSRSTRSGRAPPARASARRRPT